MLIHDQKIRDTRKRDFRNNGMLSSVVGQAAMFLHAFMDQKNLVSCLVIKRHGHISRACTGRICHVCGALPKTNFLKTDNRRFRGRDLLEQSPTVTLLKWGPPTFKVRKAACWGPGFISTSLPSRGTRLA